MKRKKIKVFQNSKKLNKRIEKLTSHNQKLALEYATELEFQGELFVKDLELQEDFRECLTSIVTE